VPKLIFPVVGPVQYRDDFGEPRGQGRHEGNDIMAPRKAVAVAVEDGKVDFWTTSARAGCMLYLEGRSGTRYLYIHLNNDLKSDDNLGKCVPGVAYAKGLKDGATVKAGQPIAFVGDSGDAEGGAPHLHFEVHPFMKGVVSPYRFLRSARKLLFAARPGTTVTLALTGTVVRADDLELALKVQKLHAKPTGLRVAKVNRTVELGVTPETLVFNPIGALIATAKLANAKAGQTALVATVPTPTTLSAALGEPLALVSERIALQALAP
jgi:hypothetical protein